MAAALSTEQVAQFQAFGHLHLPSVFTPVEVMAMRRDMEAVCTGLLGRRPTDVDHINQQPFCELSPALTPLVADGRILGPVEALLGESYLWAGSTGMWGFSEEGLEDHLWHADSGGASEGWADDPRPALFIKAFIYLDKQTRDRGALWVLPGSHRGAYHRRLLGFNDTNEARAPPEAAERGGPTGWGAPAAVLRNSRARPSVPRGRIQPRRPRLGNTLVLPRRVRQGSAAPHDHPEVHEA